MSLTCKFRKGQAVRWNAPAFRTDEERAGWIIEKVEETDGVLFPTYAVRNVATGQTGSACQPDLTAIDIGLRLPQEGSAK